MSKELTEKINQIVTEAEIPDRHTFFQIEKFIIGKEPTAHGQLWQIVREIKSRHEIIESIKKDLAQAEDDLELYDIKIERTNREIRHLSKSDLANADLDIQELELHIRKFQREKDALVKSARQISKKLKYVMEEASYLVSGYEKIIAEVGEMKPLDDEQAQKELWNEKLLEQFNLHILLKNPLDSELVRTILALDDDMPVKKHVVAILQKVQMQLMIEQEKSTIEQNKAVTKPKVEG